MTGQQDDEPWAAFPGESADDVLELGGDRRRRLRPSWWPPRIPRFVAAVAAAALAVGLGVGLGVGYAAGPRPAAAPAAAASGSGSPAAPVSAGGATLAQTGNECSVQHGTTLQLGIQVANDSATPLTLGQVQVVLPIGGLRVTAVGWGPCGELNAAVNADGDPQAMGADQYLSPGATGWLTVTTTVLVSCPTPMPVQFTVGYLQHGKVSTVQLPGFPDLSGVPYSGCPSS